MFTDSLKGEIRLSGVGRKGTNASCTGVMGKSRYGKNLLKVYCILHGFMRKEKKNKVQYKYPTESCSAINMNEIISDGWIWRSSC